MDKTIQKSYLQNQRDHASDTSSTVSAEFDASFSGRYKLISVKEPLETAVPCVIKCDRCSETFDSASSLRKHSIFHDMPFRCGECDKRFTTSRLLERHMLTHTGEKPFKCSLCEKGFIFQKRLQTHMKIHAEEKKSFECLECGKTFIRSGYLEHHMKIHWGEKLLECEVCGKRFIFQERLQAHMKVHIGERTSNEGYECGKIFNRPGHQEDDMKALTREKSYKCGECCKRFAWSIDLQKHMKSHLERTYVVWETI